MKKMKVLKRTAALIAAIMCLELSAGALGQVHYESSMPIGMNTSLHESVFTYTNEENEECLQNEHYIEYKPNPHVTPVVVYGSKVCNYGNFDTMAGLLRNKDWNVIGGINGDYYVLSTYQPIGMLITEGVLHSSDGGLWSVGFRSDGSAQIGKPATSASVTIGSTEYRVYGINKEITKSDFYLYTDTYSYTTKNTVPTINVILSCPEDYKLKVNTEAELTVEEVVSADTELSMREGKFILSLTQDSDDWRMNAVKGLAVGDKIKFKVTADKSWNDIDYAVGALYKIVDDGKYVVEADDERVSPRTAVGIRKNGSIVFYTVDGRQAGYSVGMEVPELAQRLIELGCVEACLLDGGGSTNLQAQYIGDSTITQINKSAYGSERSVSNFIMLVAKNEGSGRLQQVAVYPNDPVVLFGSEVQMEVRGADETSRPTDINEKVWWISNGGAINYEGIYTAKMKGTYDLTAYVGGMTDVSTITVIDTPDSITLHKDVHGSAISSLNVYTGESAALFAKAVYDGMEIYSSASGYKWEVVGDIGSIDENGVFTAGERQGTGRIVVKAGSCSAAIDITVGAEIREFESFEAYETDVQGLKLETSKDNVRFGNQSLRVEYEPDENGRFEAEFPISMEEKLRYLSMWIKGSRKNTKLAFAMSDGSEIELMNIETAGWHQIIVPIPADLDVEKLVVMSEEGGNAWIDQICASTTSETDLLPPDISIDEDNGNISVVLGDNIDAAVAEENITIYSDGREIEFAYNANKGIAAAYVEPVDGYRRISVTAKDQSGNVASNSLTLAVNAPVAPFEDMQEHWASEYVAYMYSQNVVNGVDDTHFAPDAIVTRAQCALMICRWLGIDTSLYADVALDFVDSADIPAYAADSVKAVYSLGIITGLDTVEGVYFAPNSSLTREQAMTIIGRVQPSGYMQADIAEYTDADKVQSWSVKYVKELVGRGIISGFEDGTIRPDAAVTRAQLAKILT
ncbi:MAG: S-layer homology domain-containing protein, partial [Oscillospiraceae bacterium]|nr:S-layer homology domain-containing protein [Oscillospiraceae bacterium]